jgi:hypothetical protein
LGAVDEIEEFVLGVGVVEAHHAFGMGDSGKVCDGRGSDAVGRGVGSAKVGVLVF